MNIFEITIQRKHKKDSWPVVVEHSKPEQLPIRRESTLRLNSDDNFAELGEFLWEPKKYGKMLGDALFDRNINGAFEKALKSISSTAPDRDDNPNCLHILLHIEDEELRQLRWEKLCAPWDGDDNWDYLLLNQKTPLSLYIPSTTDGLFPPIGRRDFQALVVAASPEGLGNFHLASFDVQATVSSIQASLGDIPCDVLARVDGAVGSPTLANLMQCLANNDKYYTVLHLVCHGKLENGEIAIYLADENNQVVPVKATELIKQLRRSRRLPHFAFLSTCEGASAESKVKKVDDDEAKKAQIGEVQAIGGLAQRLIRELGMPAVVAMTEAISIKTAEALAATFYKQLRQHGYVDLALVEATAGLQGRYDITVPALFSRLGGRPLFSDTLDRPLTKKEIEFGLERLQKLLVGEGEEEEKRGRAPVLGEKLKEHIATLQRTLNADSDKAIEEKDKALAEVKQISLEVLDLSFENLALGKELTSYDARCPFQGLYPFHYENREFFCGREELIKELQQKLSEDNFLIVSGASGSGKSSVVMAKLIPELQKKEPELVMAYMTPKDDPLAQLEASLAHVQNQPYILVVDQFEEVFTLCKDKDKQQNFIDELLKLAQNQRVILTIRVDFSGECAVYPELRNMMEKRQKIIAPMNTAKLRTAIDEQAGKVGLRFEADLLNKILDDLEGEPGVMPLLQHALKELWKKRHGRWLLSQEYRAIGGVRKAIADTADGVYNKLSSEEQEQVRNIFVRLTHLDENPIQGGQRRDTRRRVELKQLVPTNGDLAVIKKLVTLLANERLVITSQNESTKEEEVEVAHEALIRYWSTLRSWLDEDLTSLILRQRIENEAQEWENAEKKEELLLLQGSRLEDAVELSYSKNTVCLDTLAKEYVHACQQLQEKRQVDTKTQLLTAWSALAEARFRDDQLGALVYALKAGKLFQQLKESPWLESDLHVRIKIVLHQILHTMQERNRWEGYEGEVSSVTFSPDGQLLAIADFDGTTRLWNLQGKLLVSLKGDKNPVRSVSFSPDGQLLATADEGGSVRLWNLQGQQLAVWKVEQDWIRSISFSPNGQLLATGGGLKGKVQLWDLQGQQLAVWRADIAWVWSVSFSPDGQLLATGGGDNNARLWDLKGQMLATLEGHTDRVRSVSFSPNGELLVTTGDDDTIRLWDLQGQLLGGWTAEQNAVWSISFSPNGKLLATAGSDSTVRLWNLHGRRLASWEVEKGSLRSISFSPNGEFLVTAGDSGTVRLCDLQGQQWKKWRADQNALLSISFSPNGQLLATGGTESIACLWNLEGQRLVTLEKHNGLVRNACFSPNGQLLATVGDDDTVRLWNLEGKSLKNWEAKQRQVMSVSFSPDSQRLATAGADGTVCLWNLQGKKLAVWGENRNKPSSVTSVSFSPNGELLATAEENSSNVCLWDLVCLQDSPQKVWQAHTNSVNSVSFSPDGQQLATVGDDGTACLWDLQGKRLTSLRGHTGSVRSVSFNSDGQRLATAGADGTARLWDLNGQQLAVWAVHTSLLWSVSFSPDGQLLASAGLDGNVRLWRVESFDELMQRGCDWIKDYLTNNRNVSESDRRFILDGKS